jgi:hypothetical protein
VVKLPMFKHLLHPVLGQNLRVLAQTLEFKLKFGGLGVLEVQLLPLVIKLVEVAAVLILNAGLHFLR